MLLRVAQVKCFNCGRICAEVIGRSVRDLDLRNRYAPKYSSYTGLSEEAPPLCKRCGGSVYIDEPFTVGAEESLYYTASLGISSGAGERLAVST